MTYGHKSHGRYEALALYCDINNLTTDFCSDRRYYWSDQCPLLHSLHFLVWNGLNILWSGTVASNQNITMIKA